MNDKPEPVVMTLERYMVDTFQQNLGILFKTALQNAEHMGMTERELFFLRGHMAAAATAVAEVWALTQTINARALNVIKPGMDFLEAEDFYNTVYLPAVQIVATAREGFMDTYKDNRELCEQHRVELLKRRTMVQAGLTPGSNKTQDMRDVLNKIFPGTTEAWEKGICPTCQRPVKGFRDARSEREYGISGMCQDCQDGVFGGEDD